MFVGAGSAVLDCEQGLPCRGRPRTLSPEWLEKVIWADSLGVSGGSESCVTTGIQMNTAIAVDYRQVVGRESCRGLQGSFRLMLFPLRRNCPKTPAQCCRIMAKMLASRPAAQGHFQMPHQPFYNVAWAARAGMRAALVPLVHFWAGLLTIDGPRVPKKPPRSSLWRLFS